MRYFVNLDLPPSTSSTALPGAAAPPVLVDVTELPNGDLDVRVDGRKLDVDVAFLKDALSVRLDGRVLDLTTEGSTADPSLVGVVARGLRTYIRVESERQQAANATRKAGARGAESLVRSPMPGRVVKLLVAEGDEVVAGQPLLVVEAMKMENEVKAKAKAKVVTIHVAAGATVEGNAKLITLG